MPVLDALQNFLVALDATYVAAAAATASFGGGDVQVVIGIAATSIPSAGCLG